MDGIEINGLDELINFTDSLTITDTDEKKIMKNAMEPTIQEVNDNAPVRTGKMKKGIKGTVKKQDFATVGEIKLNKWYSQFTEYGTSQDKSHVGWFSRSVDNTKDEVIHRIADGCFEKAK